MNILNEILEQGTPIEEITSIESEAFKKYYFKKKKPVLIRGLAKNWRASRTWDLDFILSLKSDKEIVTLSKNYIHDGSRFKKSSFKNYIQKLIIAKRNGDEVKDYLTSVDLFTYYPELKEDIDFSNFEHLFKSTDVRAWVGPLGTVSGFHADTPDNMYAQIKGKKMFIICSTDFNKNMYPSEKHIYEATASQVDINNFEAEKFPKFKEIDFKIVILEPGDVLYLPQKWWHYVQSLDTSISISYFGYTNYKSFTLKLYERIKHSLHKRGYYKAKNCFCCEQQSIKQ